MQSAGLLRTSRVLTVAIGIPAILIAAQGYDVLYLFLLADLVCAGAFFPVLYGFYARHLTGIAALCSAAIGILVGALFFPKSDFSPWLAIPFGGDLLISFLAALLVSAGIAIGWNAVNANRAGVSGFDFNQLRLRSRTYTETVEVAPLVD
jgi:hypothetical protein